MRALQDSWYTLHQQLGDEWRKRRGVVGSRPTNVDYEPSRAGISRDDHVQAVWMRLFRRCRGVRLTPEHYALMLAEGIKLLAESAWAVRREISQRTRLEIEESYLYKQGDHITGQNDDPDDGVDQMWRRRLHVLLERTQSRDPLVHAIVVCIMRLKINPKDDIGLKRAIDQDIGLLRSLFGEDVEEIPIEEIRKAKKRLKRATQSVKAQIPDKDSLSR